MSFRAADGASYEGKNKEGHDVFKVSIPLDEHGYFGRQCPACRQIFRIHNDDYEAAADDLVLWCTYCGHQAEHDEFTTEQQHARLMHVASDAGMQLFDELIGGTFRDMARGSVGNPFFRVEYRSTPFFPTPLPGIDEEQLIRERICPTCGVRYAVLGDHRFCPFSGPLTPIGVARDAFAAEVAKLDVLGAIPADAAPALREQGLFERIYVDTLGNVVSTVESFAKQLFAMHVVDAVTILAGKGNAFQRLDQLASLFADHLGVDLRAALGGDLDEMKELWAARHVHTHNGGVVDEQYLRKVPNSGLVLGQRVLVSEPDARRAVNLGRRVCDVIAAGLAPASP